MTALTEQLAAYRLRRIEWVAARELRSGSPVVPWKVMRAAGLTSRHMPTVEAVIATMASPEPNAQPESEGFLLSRSGSKK
jgi:hypothetical protein